MTPGDSRTPDPRRKDRATGAETADLVAEVLEDAARRESARGKKGQPVGRVRQRVAAVSLPLAAAFSFYLWFGNPGWVTPAMPDPVTAQRAEAGLRVAMYVQAQRIEDFRQRTGRLPDSLAETGAAPAEMRYQRMDARTYRLVGESRGVTLTFDSSQAIQQFVGDAMGELGIGQGL